MFGARGTGTSTNTGKSEVRLVSKAIGGSFFAEFFVPEGFIKFPLSTGFCKPFKVMVGPEALVRFSCGAESCEAHIAAKLPGFRAVELEPPGKPAAEAGVALLVIADSMAEVTIR